MYITVLCIIQARGVEICVHYGFVWISEPMDMSANCVISAVSGFSL